MNIPEQEQLDRYIESFERARALYIKIMNREIDNDAAVLLHWIVNNKINSYSVFQEHIAEYMLSLLGFKTVYDTLHHAIYDDGCVCFVKISYTYEYNSDKLKTYLKERGRKTTVESLHSPMIIIDWNPEEDFEKLVLKLVNPIMKDTIVDFDVQILNSVDEYISEYNRVETENIKKKRKIAESEYDNQHWNEIQRFVNT
jgi:hypothetical protein